MIHMYIVAIALLEKTLNICQYDHFLFRIDDWYQGFRKWNQECSLLIHIPESNQQHCVFYCMVHKVNTRVCVCVCGYLAA